jgi:hypothetical protein
MLSVGAVFHLIRERNDPLSVLRELESDADFPALSPGPI